MTAADLASTLQSQKDLLAAILLPLITECLPESGWLDIPSLRKKLGDRGIAIGPGALADELSRHHHSGALRLGAWQQSAREIPHPDHAMLGPNSIVIYYVARKVSTPRAL